MFGFHKRQCRNHASKVRQMYLFDEIKAQLIAKRATSALVTYVGNRLLETLHSKLRHCYKRRSHFCIEGLILCFVIVCILLLTLVIILVIFKKLASRKTSKRRRRRRRYSESGWCNSGRFHFIILIR